VKIALNAFFLSAWAILLPSVLSSYIRGFNLMLSCVPTLFDDTESIKNHRNHDAHTWYLDRNAGPSGMIVPGKKIKVKLTL
jgi:hypothetical protein